MALGDEDTIVVLLLGRRVEDHAGGEGWRHTMKGVDVHGRVS